MFFIRKVGSFCNPLRMMDSDVTDGPELSGGGGGGGGGEGSVGPFTEFGEDGRESHSWP